MNSTQRIQRKKKLRAYHKAYRKIHKEKIGAAKKLAATQAKLEGIAHYGGKCKCCGETIVEFLTMEHINGRTKGVKKRTGKTAWLQAKAAGWPTDITLLCFNCNCAKGAFGICPHQIKKQS